MLTSLIVLRMALMVEGVSSPWVGADVGMAARSRLTIEADSTCPSGPAVADALAALVPPVQWPSGKVRIETLTNTLVVEMIANGSTKRRLPVTDDCNLRANTVALVVATWTGELASDAAGDPVLSGQAVAASRVAPAAQSVPAVASTRERELGAGALLSVLGGIAPGVRVNFVTGRAPKGLGWQVAVALPARRELAVGSVVANWTRASASIAVVGRVPTGHLLFSVDAGLVGAYTLATAHGHPVYQGQQALTGGFAAGARVALPWGRVRLWTEVRACKWLLAQAIAVDSPEGDRMATATLPSLDVQSAVGLAYVFQ